MGYVFVVGPCWSCGVTFTYHPHKVPSIPINGIRQPVCERCMRLANGRRVSLGLEPHPILPGAYEAAEAL
jgi:hypothetical protein